MTRDLSRLIRPQSIAVFGGGWSERVVEQCIATGFEGDIWPVHPVKSEICGLPTYRTVAELPAAPDASFIGVNRESTITIVSDLAARGAGGAVCFASGFKEVADGADLQDRLIAGAGTMPVLGPNCYGYINYLDGALLWPDQHGGRRVDRGVAIIAQSSNIAINLTMQQRGLPIAYVLTVGNQAQTGLADMIEAVLDDPRVTAIGLHIEGFQDVTSVEAALLKARRKKMPVVALKVGASEAAQAMTLSHTASLAGSDMLVSAFFERMNVARVYSLDVMLETLKLLHVLGPSPDTTLGSLSCSGGEASLIGDLADTTALDLRALSDGEEMAVGATLNDMVTISNPLDYHTFSWGDVDSLTRTYGAMLDCGFGLTCLILDIPRPDRCVDNGCEASILAAIETQKNTGGRFAVIASIPENMSEELADRLIAAGIAPLMGLHSGVLAMAAAAQIGVGFKVGIPATLAIEKSTAQEVKTAILNEWNAKAILREHGLSTPKGVLAQTIDEAVRAGENLRFPVALKAMLSDVAHKTEMGGVALNVKSSEELRAAAQKMSVLNAPFLVEKMVVDPVAEIILGVSRDSQFGTYLTIGAGGVMVEVLKDARVLLLPVTRDDVRAALLSLQSAPLLTGFRGGPVADLDAIVDAAICVADYALSEGEALEELDVNPLIICAKGAYAADAMIVKRVSS